MNEITNLPPNAIDLEEAVLGACLLTDAAATTAMEFLTAESFYKFEHVFIFTAIAYLKQNSRIADIMSVAEELRRMKKLKDIGGPGYIARLTNKIGSAELIEQHCRYLKEKYTARRQIELASHIIRRAYDPSTDVFETNAFMADEVFKIGNLLNVSRDVNNLDLANALTTDIEYANANQGITGVPVGFRVQDNLTGGWQNSDLIIMAARPGMGKTAKMLCDILNAGLIFNKRMVVFSLEMSAVQLFKRMASIVTGVPAEVFRRGMTEAHWRRYHERLQPLIENKITIVDDCYMIQEIVGKLKKLRLQYGELHGCYIDYLQLVEAKAGNREQEISTISRTLKKTAKSMNIPIVALSQLSRKVDERANKRPQLSDLRESGAIEQDADIVTFLYRPRYYDEHSNDPYTYYIFAKHRNGLLQDVTLRFIPEQTKFVDADEDKGPEITF